MDEHKYHSARDRNQGIWIEHSDRLYVAAYSSVASLSVRFSGYFRKMDGEIIEYAVTVNPTSDRAATEGNVFFGAGFLLSCVATLASGNANRGQCYVRAQVQRNTGTPMLKLHNVLGGYVTDDYSPSFPYGKIEGSLEGPGNLRSITGTDPAAGSEISETVPTGARWKIYSVFLTLVADATVASRVPHLLFDDGTNTLLRLPAVSLTVASETNNYIFAHFARVPYEHGVACVEYLTPFVLLAAASRMLTITTAIQAGDNYAAPQLSVEEWLEV